MKEIIELQQLTPMWHFQPDLSGCCLRATEVKPKLDTFLLKKSSELAEYRIRNANGSKIALDYKLSFIAPDEKTPCITRSPLFFGNLGKQQKKMVFYGKDPIEMHVFSFHKELIEAIKNNLCEFFATHSFGTRQDKGFGFFFPKKENGLTGKPEDAYGAQYMFKLPYKDFDSIFNAIHYFHKLIRSGINEGGCYYKSLMYFYARDISIKSGKPIQWDKPTIRHHFELYTEVYKSICGQSPYSVKNFYVDKKKNKYPPREEMMNEYRKCSSEKCQKWLFRDALGLAGAQVWKAYDDKISIKAHDRNFTRFKSPVLYRPVIKGDECIVYIHFDSQSLEEIKKQSFRISNKNRDRDPISGIRIYPDFSLEDYFSFIEKRYKDLVGVQKLSITGKPCGGITNRYIEVIFKPFAGGKGNFRKV